MDRPLELLLADSPLPAPAPGGPAAAFEHHVERYARWLRAAGAEGRLTLALCSGAGAKERLVASLKDRNVNVVRATATDEAAVHPALRNHVGDHFNDTLFLVDGLVGPGAEGRLAALGRETRVLKRMATWVAVVIEDLAGLAAFEVAALLRLEVERRVLFIDDSPAEPGAAPLDVVERWRSRQQMAELIFNYALDTSAAPEYHDFARFVRSGYAGARPAGGHPDRARLLQIWRGARTSDESAEGGAAVAEAALRHGGGEPGAWGPRLTDPAARYACGLPVDVPLLSRMAKVRVADASPADDAVLRTEAAAEGVGPGLRAHAELAIAEGAAATGDVDRLEAALNAADGLAHGARSVAPELVFDVIEKRARVEAFRNRRGEARSLVDQLESRAPELQSPFWDARLSLARGELVAPLDALKAREHYDTAIRIFERFGYAEWVSTARAGRP